LLLLLTCFKGGDYTAWHIDGEIFVECGESGGMFDNDSFGNRGHCSFLEAILKGKAEWLSKSATEDEVGGPASELRKRGAVIRSLGKLLQDQSSELVFLELLKRCHFARTVNQFGLKVLFYIA